jgi:hypothetical protein
MNGTLQKDQEKAFVENYLFARGSWDATVAREEARLDEFFSQISKRRSLSNHYLLRRSGEHVIRVESDGAMTHVTTSGEGMGEKQYTVVNEGPAFKIEIIEIRCPCCDGMGLGLGEPLCSICKGAGWTEVGD